MADFTCKNFILTGNLHNEGTEIFLAKKGIIPHFSEGIIPFLSFKNLWFQITFK